MKQFLLLLIIVLFLCDCSAASNSKSAAFLGLRIATGAESLPLPQHYQEVPDCLPGGAGGIVARPVPITMGAAPATGQEAAPQLSHGQFVQCFCAKCEGKKIYCICCLLRAGYCATYALALAPCCCMLETARMALGADFYCKESRYCLQQAHIYSNQPQVICPADLACEKRSENRLQDDCGFCCCLCPVSDSCCYRKELREFSDILPSNPDSPKPKKLQRDFSDTTFHY